MKLNSELVDEYINNKDINKYKNKWFFKIDGYEFKVPPAEEGYKKIVNKIYIQIRKAINNFLPLNIKIWDAIFPEWKEILEEVKINLIIGWPEPNDATILKNSNGENEVFLDLGNWIRYYNKCNLDDLINNLLTHELCHISIGKYVSNIDKDIHSENYNLNLDANTFHEGFAHLVSYENTNIDDVNWNSKELISVRARNYKIMGNALSEKELSKQNEYLYDAIFGDYYNKFACMCGMFYLVKCYENGGVDSIKKVFEKGYIGFAKQTIS